MKHYLLKTWLMLLLLVVGVGSSWAETSSWTHNGKAEDKPESIGDFTVTWAKGSGSAAPTGYDESVRLYAAKNGTGNIVTISNNKGYYITKVELTGTVNQGTLSFTWSGTTSATGNYYAEYAESAKTTTVTATLKNTNTSKTGQFRLTGIKITYTTSGGGTNPDPEPGDEDGTASFIFNTDAGLSALGITKPAQSQGTNLGTSGYSSGAITMKATNGTNASRVWNSQGTTSLRVYSGNAATEAGTLTFSGATITQIAFTGTVPMTANVGEFSNKIWTGEATSVTFTATSSTEISKIEVTYEGGGTPVAPLTTMDEIFAAATTAGSTAVDTKITFGDWVVTGVSNSNAYLTDGNKGMLIFKSGHGFEVGDILSGTLTTKLLLYNGAAEFNALTATTPGLTITKGGSIEPISVATSNLDATYTGVVLHYDNMVYNAASNTFSDGENIITPYHSLYDYRTTLIDGKTYNITGVYTLLYNERKNEILPRSAEDIVLVEELNKYVVTIETPENGTLTVKDGETVINNGDEVAEGTTLTIECSPVNEDYRFVNWQYKAEGMAAFATRTKDFTYTMPSANVQFRANFEAIPVYTIAWSVNGTIVKIEDLKEGAAVTAPADPEAINDKVFTGWIETATVEGETPAYVTPSATATKTVTYYAVFATQEGSGSQIVYELTTSKISDNLNSSTRAYADAEGTYDDGDVEWGYVGFTQTKNANYLQIRNTSPASYVSFDAPENITKVAFGVTNGNNNNFTGSIYIKTSADATSSNSDENIVATVAVTGAKTGEATITGNHTKLYMQASATARITTITLTCGSNPAYSDYTTLPNGGTFTIASAAHDSKTNAYYGTYYVDHCVTIPEGCEAATVTVENNKMKLDYNWRAGEVVPANTGILIKAEKEGKYVYPIGTNPKAAGNNMLKGSTKEGLTEGGDKYYKLAGGSNGIGFYWGKENGAAFTSGANKAYLAVPGNVQAKSFSFFDEDNTDAINSVMADAEGKEIYNLAGQRVMKAQKGIYIVNGKKMMFK